MKSMSNCELDSAYLRSDSYSDLLVATTKGDVGRGYGSTTATLETTEAHSSSSSLSQHYLSPIPSGSDEEHPRVNLDLTSMDDIDKNDNGEKGAATSGHSRDDSSSSSYSDLSIDGGGYYNRFNRHLQRSKESCDFLENSVFTPRNVKVFVSFALWFVSYMAMGIFGGSVAYMHFERRGADVPEPLPDFGYDVIPYWCPRILHVPHENVQSIVLFVLYAIILSGVVLRWHPRHHPKSGAVVWGGDGRLVLQQLFHLNCLVFLTRTSTVGVTGLPQPNPRCVDEQLAGATFVDAVRFVMGRGFPPHACGDLIYSGHVGCTLICMSILRRHGFMRNRVAAAFLWSVASIGIYFTVSCRSHYSVDVVLAFYFGYFLPEWYYVRSDGLVGGRVSRWIRNLEVRPEDLRLPL